MLVMLDSIMCAYRVCGDTYA